MEKFIYTYSVFLFFILFIISMGATEVFAGNIEGLEAPTIVPPDPTGDPIWDFITGAVNTGAFLINNIAFFFTLMFIDVGVAWVGTLIFSPAIVLLVYGLLKLIRGGG